MKIDWFTDATIFEKLANEWDELLTRAVIDTLFLTREYQMAWWKNLGTGELRVITFRNDDGTLVGIAPLFAHKTDDGLTTLSLIGCVLFNLLIHLRYGKELFLYSPNWTYAIILLLGISWKNLLAHKWFQILLIAFLLLLMLNNAALLCMIMETSAPYIK